MEATVKENNMKNKTKLKKRIIARWTEYRKPTIKKWWEFWK